MGQTDAGEGKHDSHGNREALSQPTGTNITQNFPTGIDHQGEIIRLQLMSEYKLSSRVSTFPSPVSPDTIDAVNKTWSVCRWTGVFIVILGQSP